MNEQMAQPPPMTGAPQRIVLWIIWFVLTAAVPLYPIFLGKGLFEGKNAPGSALPPMFFFGLAQLGAATIVRWLVLPRFAKLQQKLVWMVVGLSLSEGPVFYSIFLFPANQPETKTLMVVLCFLSMLQFIPLYAREPYRNAFR